MIDVVTFDLDSTIADTRQRQWMIKLIKSKNHPDTWEDYSLACVDDEPMEGTIALMRMLNEQYPLFIITSRNDVAHDLTAEWLQKHDVPYAGLLMRESGDHSDNGKHKVSIINELRNQGYRVVLHVDDWPEVGNYIKKHTDIPVLTVAGHYVSES